MGTFTVVYLTISVLVLAISMLVITIGGELASMAEMGISGIIIFIILALLWPISTVLVFFADEFEAWVNSLSDKTKEDRLLPILFFTAHVMRKNERSIHQ